MRKNIKTINKYALPAVLVIAVVLTVVAPVLISTVNAAEFNTGSQPWKTLRAYNYSDNGSCSSCWENDDINVDAGDIVTVRIFYQNTSGELAENTRVRIYPSVSYNGETAEITGRVWADNASTITDTVTIRINSNQKIASLSHTGDTFWYDGFLNQKSLLYGQNQSDVLNFSGLGLGNVVPGLENSGFVVVRFTVNGGEINNIDRPDVITRSAINIDEGSAVLRGGVNPNGGSTDAWFEWGTSRFNLNRDTSRQNVGSGNSSVNFDERITGLSDDTTYYYRAVAENDEGIDRGSVFSFRTDDNGRGDDRPDIRDVDVENIDDDSARLVCTVDANGNTTSVWFEWDEDEDDVDDGDGEDTRRVSVSRSHTRRDVKITITGLDDDTRYFFRCVARNSEGTDRSRIEDFRTDDNDRSSRDEPDVTTRSATDIGQTSAVLRGEADPNGEDTDVWFQWGTSRSNLSKSSRIEDIGDGTREKDFDRQITGLRVNTTYYFRAVAENREGIDRGGILTFRTGTVVVGPPTIITRIVEVIREIRSEPEIEGLIITLETDTTNINRGELVYEISYDNRTDDTFTDAELIIELPNELEFVDASPREDNVRGDTVSFEIGTIRPGDNESFVIETEVGRRVDEKDDIIFSASINYIDGDDKKIVTLVDVTRIADARGGGFMALFAGNLAGFFTNPFLWLIILLVVIFFVYRYFASLAKPKEEAEFLDNVLQPPLPQDNEL